MMICRLRTVPRQSPSAARLPPGKAQEVTVQGHGPAWTRLEARRAETWGSGPWFQCQPPRRPGCRSVSKTNREEQKGPVRAARRHVLAGPGRAGLARSSDGPPDGRGESQRAGRRRPALGSACGFWSLAPSCASVSLPIKGGCGGGSFRLRSQSRCFLARGQRPADGRPHSRPARGSLRRCPGRRSCPPAGPASGPGPSPHAELVRPLADGTTWHGAGRPG